MTNKEAIGQLEWIKRRISNIVYSPESYEALNLAIKALEDEQCYQEMQKPAGGQVVPDVLQGWRYQEAENDN